MKTNALTKIDRDLSTAFDDFFKPWNEWFVNGNAMGRALSLPSVNIAETEKAFTLELMAPGQQKKDFVIDVDGNMLTISSDHEQKEEELSKKFSRKEYSFSSFSRTFTIPGEVDKSKIDAVYDNGVLTVTLPKDGNQKKKDGNKIEIR
ncbi:Hsp20/alpha crystallin family protein [Sediminibacterium roseum]|uniref:Hsp20/alpha crystallin family protein n=1 Tax=Sediminibacterium roseum TaxID=1978412 RepID=A0ABX0A4E6_9BACT|nr:Hsp20/alpha crystallin family protein [Sediminibacterium roseum]NCI52070.1 Hsp20/alpha crystallin family protein [Sediminibacterium roseum]